METKSNNKNRNRAFSRFQRNRVINRKKKLMYHTGFEYAEPGYLAKGKIHCSCWMCSSKTNRNGFPHAQVKKIQAGNTAVSDFYRFGEEM